VTRSLWALWNRMRLGASRLCSFFFVIHVANITALLTCEVRATLVQFALRSYNVICIKIFSMYKLRFTSNIFFNVNQPKWRWHKSCLRAFSLMEMRDEILYGDRLYKQINTLYRAETVTATATFKNPKTSHCFMCYKSIQWIIVAQSSERSNKTKCQTSIHELLSRYPGNTRQYFCVATIQHIQVAFGKMKLLGRIWTNTS
jgi:hypothetical protein